MDLINNNQSGYRGFLNDNQYSNYIGIPIAGAYGIVRKKQNVKGEQQAGQRISEYAQGLEGEREEYRRRFLSTPQSASAKTTDVQASQEANKQTSSENIPQPKKSKALLYGIIAVALVGSIFIIKKIRK
jgi:hypothetical protein